MAKKQKGITMITLAVTVVLILIITGAVISRRRENTKKCRLAKPKHKYAISTGKS